MSSRVHHGYINIVVPNIPAPCDVTQAQVNSSLNNSQKQIKEIKVWDNLGNLKMTIRGNGSENQRVNVSQLKKGIYLIEIINNEHSEKHQVILQ